MEGFGENLRMRRIRSALSVPEAAEQADVSVATWYKYENGEQWPRSESVFRRVCEVVSLKPNF